MRKNLLLTFILYLSVSQIILAQTEKGSKIVGGGAAVQFKPLIVAINPGAGFFLVDNFAIGAQLPFTYIGEKYGYNYSVGLSPFIRYYLGKSSTRVFAGAFGGISKVWRGYDYSGIGFGGKEERSEGSNNFGFNLGLVHFISKQVGLEAAFIYDNDKLAFDNSGATRIETLSFNVGFQIYFPKFKE